MLMTTMSAGIDRVLHAQALGGVVAFRHDQQSSVQVVGGIVALITTGSVVQLLLYCILCCLLACLACVSLCMRLLSFGPPHC